MDRINILSRKLKFRCATTGVPGKSKPVRMDHAPTNLAELLIFIRGMGYRPEDIAVYEMEWEHEYGSVTTHY